MPEVPYTGLPSTSPREAPPDDYQRVNVSPEQFGGAIGKGVQQAGKGIEDLGNDFFQTAAFQEKINADDQINGFLTNHNAVLYGDPTKHTVGPDGQPVPDTGFMGLEGRAASDHREDALKTLEDTRRKGAENLKSPQAKLIYDQQIRRMMADTTARIDSHTDQQWKVYAQGVNHAGADLTMNDYLRSVGSNDVEAARNHAADYVQQKVQAAQIKFGFDPKIEKAAEQGARFDLLKAQVDFVGAKNPAGALKILDQPENKAIAGTHYDDLYREMRTRAVAQTGQTKADQYVAEATKGGVGPVGNLPAPTAAFLRQRSGSARVDGVNPVFADRLVKAATDFEAENPGRLARFESLNRTRDEQTRLYQRYQAGQGGLAAPPGQSRHEYGLAADVPDGAFLNWLHDNGSKYGLEFLKGRAFLNDSGHVQLAGASPGAGRLAPQAPGQAAPAAGGGLMPALTPVSMPGAPMPPVAAPGGVVTVAPPHVEMPVAETQTPTLRMQLASAMRSAINDPDMNDDERRAAEAAIQQRFRVLEISENQQTETAKALNNDAAAKYTQSLGQMQYSSTPDYIGLDKAIIADPHLDFKTKHELRGWVADASGGHVDKTYGPGFWDVFKQIHAPDHDPGKITDPQQLMAMVGPGKALTIAGYEKAVGEINGSRTPQGAAAAHMEKEFLEKVVRPELVRTVEFPATDTTPATTVYDQRGEVRFQRFLAAYYQERDRGKAAGKTMMDMLDPDNKKDYLGRLIEQFRPPEAERFAEAVNATPPSWFARGMQGMLGYPYLSGENAPPPDTSKMSAEEIVAAVKAKTLPRADAVKALRERGFDHAAPGPQVPQSGPAPIPAPQTESQSPQPPAVPSPQAQEPAVVSPASMQAPAAPSAVAAPQAPPPEVSPAPRPGAQAAPEVHPEVPSPREARRAARTAEEAKVEEQQRKDREHADERRRKEGEQWEADRKAGAKQAEIARKRYEEHLAEAKTRRGERLAAEPQKQAERAKEEAVRNAQEARRSYLETLKDRERHLLGAPGDVITPAIKRELEKVRAERETLISESKMDRAGNRYEPSR